MADKEEWTTVEPKTDGVIHDFEKDKEIQGTYVKQKSDIGPNNSNLYTIKKEDGEEASFWGSTVLDDRMAELELGMFVRIVFTGRQTPKSGGKPYKTYDVMYRSDTKQETVDVNEVEF